MTEVYRIGVTIAMTSNASEVLGVIGSGLLSLGDQAKALRSDLQNVRTAARGAMATIIGNAALAGLGRMISAAKDLNHQLSLMKSRGMPDFSVAADATAWQVASSVPARTSVGKARSLHRAGAILGTSEDAAGVLPNFARAAVVPSSVAGGSQEDAGQTLANALALRGGTTNPTTGQINAAQFGTELNLALKAIIASAGLADQEQLPRVMRTSGLMARMMDPTAFYKLMLTAVMETGGFRAGWASSGAGRQLYGAAITLRNNEETERLDLARPGSLHTGHGGRIVADPHFLTGERILNGPGLQKQDLRGEALTRTANDTEPQETYRLASSQDFGRLLGFFLHQQQSVWRDQRRFEQAYGTAAYSQLMGTARPWDSRRDRNSYGPPPPGATYGDRTAKIAVFEAAWKNLLTAFRAPMVDAAINLLGKATSALNGLATSSAAHPLITGHVEEWTAAIAGLSVVRGTVALISAAASSLRLFRFASAAASGPEVLAGAEAFAAVSTALAPFAAGGVGAAGLAGLSLGVETLLDLMMSHQPKIGAALLKKPRGAPAGTMPGAAARIVPGIARAVAPAPATPPASAGPAAPPFAPAPASPIQKAFYEVPAGGNVHVIQPIAAHVNIDGRTLGQIVFHYGADHATLPPSAGTGYDPSMTPTYTASLIGNA